MELISALSIGQAIVCHADVNSDPAPELTLTPKRIKGKLPSGAYRLVQIYDISEDNVEAQKRENCAHCGKSIRYVAELANPDLDLDSDILVGLDCAEALLSGPDVKAVEKYVTERRADERLAKALAVELSKSEKDTRMELICSRYFQGQTAYQLLFVTPPNFKKLRSELAIKQSLDKIDPLKDSAQMKQFLAARLLKSIREKNPALYREITRGAAEVDTDILHSLSLHKSVVQKYDVKLDPEFHDLGFESLSCLTMGARLVVSPRSA